MHPAISSLASRLLVDRTNQHRKRVLQAFRSSQLFECEKRALIDDEVEGKLFNLLNYARDHIPRFKKLLPPGPLSPRDAYKVLQALPAMQRAEIQENPSSFVPGGTHDYVVDATGGSTGTPMTFRVDLATQQSREASLMWADHLAGWKYGERIAMLWGSDKDVASATHKLRSDLRNWVENRRWYNAFDMGASQMSAYHSGLLKFQPHLLVAYAGSLGIYARYLREQNVAVNYPLKAVISSAEMLYPETRKVAESVFGKPVFNRYGNREFGAIAAECSGHTGMHLNEKDMFVEIDSPDPFQIPGPILVTYFHNRAMPFIRYDTGDLGVMEEGVACACGRTTKKVKSIVGRQSDTIKTLSGTLIHGEYFTHLMYGARGVRKFQFIQNSMMDYQLVVEGRKEDIGSQEDHWRRDILERVGPEAQLSFIYVDSIPPLPSGKHQFTLSKCTPH